MARLESGLATASSIATSISDQSFEFEAAKPDAATDARRLSGSILAANPFEAGPSPDRGSDILSHRTDGVRCSGSTG